MDLETLRLVIKAFAYSPLLCSSEMTLGHEEYMKALTLGIFSIANCSPGSNHLHLSVRFLSSLLTHLAYLLLPKPLCGGCNNVPSHPTSVEYPLPQLLGAQSANIPQLSAIQGVSTLLQGHCHCH